MKKSQSVNIMISQDQGESGKEDSENGEDLSSHTIPGTSECSERSPSVTDEASVDCSEKSISVQKYEEEWEQIYFHEDPDLGELRRRAVTGNLRASRFRSVCWRALLSVFSNDKSSWLKELRRFRQHYEQMSQEFCVDPWLNSNPEDNPLNQNAGSSWHQHFCDNELKAVIRQDVVRTFPGVDYFRKETVQKAMLNVLFVYARENPDMCYRQGMHEILAPLLFVLHCDHQALLHTKEQVPVSDSVSEMLDPAYLEADSYSLFCLIMEGISCYYKINDSAPSATGYFPPNLQSPVPPPGGKGKENEILVQLESIKENLLVPNDKELAEYLNRLEITLPVFGIRWLRLLFGREFPLQDLLVLWDAIFAEGKDFGLVHYVVVAMLVAIRNQLLDSDYTTCLMHLMRYPGAVDITFIIEHALYLKDHQKYNRPVCTSFPPLPKKASGQPESHRSGHSGRHLSTHSLPRTKSVSSVNRDEKSQQRKPRAASGSSLSDRFKNYTRSTKSGQWSAVKSHRSSSVRGEGDSNTSGTAAGAGIVEGFALNDPTVIISELQRARAVMSLCRLKLAQYRGILSEAINPAEYPDAQQALDGMNEIP
ncbi:TBC1 domain family member 5 [Gryllus bimaculatus]|nr:TBC1 domain family member 5 [Gryllus bimaculatus]